MKKKYLLPTLFVLSVSVFLLIQPRYSKQELALKELEKQKKTHKDIKTQKKEKTNFRKIASIPTKKPDLKIKDKPMKREIIGSRLNENQITMLNSVAKDWKDKYQKSFLRMTKNQQIKNLEVTLKRSIVKVENNIGKNLEHIIVSYTNQKGDPFSFEALVDSSTGQTVQSWNKTRYEFKTPLKLKGNGKKLYRD